MGKECLGYMRRKTWELTDHVCRVCGGRILLCVSGQGPTGGGNPIWRCADCGVACASIGPASICWCGFTHRGQDQSVYCCCPFSVLEQHPEMLKEFRSCGCDPGRTEIGIVTQEAFRKMNGG